MEKIDVSGLSCPIPVVRVKKLIDQGCPEISIVGDSGVSRENVQRLAVSCGYTVSLMADQPDRWEMEIRR